MGYVLAELLQHTFSRVKMFQNICIKSIETITSITLYQHVLKNRGTKLRLVVCLKFIFCLNFGFVFSVSVRSSNM